MSELAVAMKTAPGRATETAHATDGAIMRAIAAGDRSAFSRVYTTHAPRAYRLAYGVLLDRDEAREAVQEAFFKLHRGAATWEPRATISTWLHRVILNQCLNAKRRLRQFGQGEHPRSRSPSPELAAALGQAVAVVEATLAGLAARERAMLTLYLDGQMSPSEIAPLVALTPNATRVALHRAVAKLREDLRAAGIEAARDLRDSFADLEEEADVHDT